MVVYEHSAGGVVYRKQADTVEVLLLKDKNNNWSFPKGLIEKNEDQIKTATREIAEEVGLQNLTFIAALSSIRYFYRFQGNLIRKKVDYYFFSYSGQQQPKPLASEGIQDVRWFKPDEALAIIGYEKTNKPILEKALLWIGKKHQT